MCNLGKPLELQKAGRFAIIVEQCPQKLLHLHEISHLLLTEKGLQHVWYAGKNTRRTDE